MISKTQMKEFQSLFNHKMEHLMTETRNPEVKKREQQLKKLSEKIRKEVETQTERILVSNKIPKKYWDLTTVQYEEYDYQEDQTEKIDTWIENKENTKSQKQLTTEWNKLKAQYLFIAKEDEKQYLATIKKFFDEKILVIEETEDEDDDD